MAPAPRVARALLMLTTVMALLWQGCLLSVKGEQYLFGRSGVWTCSLTPVGCNLWCGCWLEPTPSLPLGRVKIRIPCTL